MPYRMQSQALAAAHHAPPATVLAIDDEPHNLKILQQALEDEGYNMLEASCGEDGWKLLQAHKDTIQVILLDRQMPGMDGIEFVHRLKQDASVARIPVIMQTAASARQQILEGIAAGVYYYLTKPFFPEALQPLVAAAIRDYQALRKPASADAAGRFYGAVQECTLHVRHCDEIEHVTGLLADFFPDPDRVALGISELLMNAIEHGNLAIGYEEKSQLQAQGYWLQELQHRLRLPEFAHKRVEVRFIRHPNECCLTIRDEGAGFDWQRYMEISPDRVTDSHGRGIAFSRMMSFDTLTYQGAGNVVECSVACV